MIDSGQGLLVTEVGEYYAELYFFTFGRVAPHCLRAFLFTLAILFSGHP